MSWYTRFAIVAGAGLLALVVFLSLVAAEGSSGSGAGVTPSGGPIPTSTTVPPNCDPPKMCPVVVDTDKDGYSDYDENAYGSDPNNPASTPESWAFGTCQDGIDNDLDGATDGADSGCMDPCASPPAPMMAPGEPDYYPYCDKDSDGDGFFDSDEINSGSDPNNPASTPEDWGHGTCGDGVDNDLDGATDGSDTACAAVCEPPAPVPMALASDSTLAGAVVITPGGTPVDGGGGSSGQTCDKDSDGDGYSDWEELNAGSDPNNAASTPEATWYPGTCDDGVDNDLDGQTDSADDACSSGCVSPVPEPGQTPDGGGTSPSQPCVADSDGDGVDDGTEQMLGSDPSDPNSTPEHLKFPDSCTDGTDNDGDGLTDALDPGCQPDSDGDGVTDSTDNCPAAWNPDQADSDQDGTGDACQDLDGDGYSDAEETSWGSDPDNAASTPEVLWVYDSCNDGLDNDGDQATDSGDSGCAPRVPLPPGSGMPEEFVGKDANCDLRINALDALLILRSAARLPAISSESPCAATAQGGTAPGDSNCSGTVDMADSLDVLRYVAGLSSAPGHC